MLGLVKCDFCQCFDYEVIVQSTCTALGFLALLQFGEILQLHFVLLWLLYSLLIKSGDSPGRIIKFSTKRGDDRTLCVNVAEQQTVQEVQCGQFVGSAEPMSVTIKRVHSAAFPRLS